MPPRLNLPSASRSLTIRTRPSVGGGSRIAPAGKTQQWRAYATQQQQQEAEQKQPGGPNESGIGHITEETIGIEDVRGGTKPDLEQGTPVQEVCTFTHQLLLQACDGILDVRRVVGCADCGCEGSSRTITNL